jgi:hypothetical protein
MRDFFGGAAALIAIGLFFALTSVACEVVIVLLCWALEIGVFD